MGFSPGDETPEAAPPLIIHLALPSAQDCGLGNEDKIEAVRARSPPEAFPKQPLGPIAENRPPEAAAGRETHSTLFRTAGSGPEGEEREGHLALPERGYS